MKEILDLFIKDDVYNNDIIYIFEFENGDIFKTIYFGERESEVNPLTGEDDSYYAFDFEIIEVIRNSTQQYDVGSLIQVSKYNYPSKIKKA